MAQDLHHGFLELTFNYLSQKLMHEPASDHGPTSDVLPTASFTPAHLDLMVLESNHAVQRVFDAAMTRGRNHERALL
jgi:hypothetical protein